MSRSLRIGLLLALVGLGAAAPRGANAQPATATGADKSATGADKSAAGAAPASSAGALPPGHPPTGAMPPGHPPTGAMPPGHPPTGAMPPGHPPAGAGAMRQADPGFFVPPPNTAEDDPTLPAGTLVVTIRDAEDKPIPGAPVRLDILKRSVAQGDSTEQRSAVADGSGAARFEGLPVGSTIFYQPTTKRGPASFSATPFTLGAEVGKRSVLHAYEATSDINEAFVLAQGVVFLALREDSIVVEQSFTLGNLSPVAWVADVTVPLPQGFRALNREETDGNLRLEEVNGVGIAMRGTVSPGRHDLSFRYNVPFEKQSSQTVRVELPPHVAAMRVFAEAGKGTKLEVVGFPAARPEELRNGAKVLFTEERAQRGTGGLKPLVINLSGLPTPPPGRWVALGLAITGVLGALAMLLVRRQEGTRAVDDETRRELMEARDALLDEFAELERARKRGEIGPKTYTRVREGLLDALARIVAMIEEAEASAAPKQDGPKRGAGGKAAKRKAGSRAAPESGSASAS